MDKECPLCVWEMNMIEKRQKQGKGNIKLKFINSASSDYDSKQNKDIAQKEALRNMHAIKPDGTIITKFDAMLLIYEAAGLTRTAKFMRLPGVYQLNVAAYKVWARIRFHLTFKPKRYNEVWGENDIGTYKK